MKFDHLLQQHLAHLDLLMVCLGLPDHREGARRITTTDQLWRERFHHLAERARSILVVPGVNEGIKAEIR
jgi:hypothetical protein